MPLYDFSGESTTKFDGKSVLPGERFEADMYFSDDELGLVSHLPQVSPAPIKSFFSEDIVAGVVSSVTIDAEYKRLSLYNICGGILKAYVNEDSSNTITIANNSFWEFDNRNSQIGEINLSGEASGRVDVSGDMNTL